jgi:hypothetical protein
MKTYFKRFLATLLFFMILCTTSCLGSKKVTEKSSETTEKTEVTQDSTTKIDTSGEIKDTIIVNVPETDNEEVRLMFETMLRQLNTSKSSGSNSYTSRYDKETNQLMIEYIIGQTQNKEVSSEKDTKIEKSFEESIDEYVKKFVIPWWMYAIVVFMLRKEIFWVISKLFPGLSFLPRFPTK